MEFVIIWKLFNPMVVSITTGFFLIFILIKLRNRPCMMRPPGPKGWPVLGNMFELGDLPHQTMHKLKSKYGPVLWLQLGSKNTMVVQNAAAAAELFKNHDISFCDRTPPLALTALGFNEKALSLTDYGGYWRVLRRLCTTEFLSNKRLEETTEVRKRIINDMVRWIGEDSTESLARGGTGAVKLRDFLFLMTFNVTGNLILSEDLLDSKDSYARDFFECVHVISELAGTPNIAEFLPFLKWMDPQGMQRKVNREMKKTLAISSKFVKDRLEKRKAGQFEEKKDFLDVLLDFEEDGKDEKHRFTENDVNFIIMEMFIAGTDTSVHTMEWSLAELLRNPHALKKVQEEIDRVVGLKRKVQESDIKNLIYLQAVIKESLRLHPAVPLLFPRKAVEDTNYMGYLIPKGTQVLVNAWGIGRDAEYWEDPMAFKPERFLSSSIEYKGQHFELIPFGSGRRICIGLSLAQRMVHIVLASLVQEFDWDLGDGIKPDKIDRDEKLGLLLSKKVPLEIIPKKRLHI